MDYKETLNLPRTAFPMKAGLPSREPEILAYWKEIDLERRVAEARKDAPAFVLHDGPPYTNGHIHLGHLLNKTLKDVINKYQTMKGRRTPYVPGWDTHGLPIERAVLTRMGLSAAPPDPVALRAACRAYARDFIAIMTDEFRRLGVRADWDRPYATLDKAYEAEEIRVFGQMYDEGLILKDFKSVNWCPECETALAEAEIEYKEVTSHSLFVAFPVTRAEGPLEEADRVLTWTTTAWTLPANRAVALHPDATYVRAQGPEGPVVLGERAYLRLREDLGLGAVLQRFPGRAAEGVRVGHPVFDVDVPLILGEHVTEDEGTGAVHTAPGHGEEDFEIGRRYGLDVIVPVDGKGVFTKEAGPFEGIPIGQAYAGIVDHLARRGRLVRELPIRHQYPHCWRSKGPVIFRATEQWFFSISKLRPKLLEAIGEVGWVPGWGAIRMTRMTEDRGEWCISRQRVWGLPIPALYCVGCGHVVVKEATDTIASRFAREGSDIWWTDPAEGFLPAGFRCPLCGGTRFRKETDTLDVWFDSGSSHLAVLNGREGLHWPADLYLEGSDQFRGWFNSSLTTGVAVRGSAPYRTVLAHGFITDDLGDKMSKSRGNTVAPEELMSRYGADILRLWATSSDFKADVTVSHAILDQVAEGYRKIRNTLRFVLGNLNGVDPDAPVPAERPLVERYIASRTGDLVRRVDEAYRSYDFHLVYHHLLNFASVDLSSFYMDVRKDLLYTGHPRDPERLAAQKTLEAIGRALLAMVAPILTFSAEDAWGYFPKRRDDPPTVQLLSFPADDAFPRDGEAEALFDLLLPVRQVVLKALETARASKEIGSGLDAAVTLEAGPDLLPVLLEREDLLETLCVVSDVKVVASGTGRGVSARVARAPGEKCQRCWRVLPEVGTHTGYPDLCLRCADVVRRWVPTGDAAPAS